MVGGVGPSAGTDLVHKVFCQTRASADQEHLPVILISLPHTIADRTEYVLGRCRTNPAGAIFRVVRLLERAGASVIGIPCNTAHAPGIFGPLEARLRRAGSRVKLLHLIEEVGLFLRRRHPAVKRVGLLASTGTCRSGVYEAALARRGMEVILPPRQTQERLVQPAVYDRRYGIKARSNPVTARARRAVRKAMDELLAAGAQAVILGCTELPLAYERRTYRDRPVIDSTLVLARALIREAAPSKLRD